MSVTEKREYIAKVLNPILQELVYDVLEAEPPDPIPFMIDWMQTRSEGGGPAAQLTRAASGEGSPSGSTRHFSVGESVPLATEAATSTGPGGEGSQRCPADRQLPGRSATGAHHYAQQVWSGAQMAPGPTAWQAMQAAHSLGSGGHGGHLSATNPQLLCHAPGGAIWVCYVPHGAGPGGQGGHHWHTDPRQPGHADEGARYSQPASQATRAPPGAGKGGQGSAAAAAAAAAATRCSQEAAPPFEAAPGTSLTSLGDPRRHTEKVKWLVPMAFAMFGFYVQSVCLHYATYSYVHAYAVDPGTPPGANKYAVLADPVEEALGEENISIGCLDLIAGFFPACFFALSMLLALGEVYVSNTGTVQLTQVDPSAAARKDKYKTKMMKESVQQLWTKVMLCQGCLFILKGVVGAVTTVPDSSGWEVCKARLKPEGVQWMKEEHSFWSMLPLDFWWNAQYRHPLRYCSDMMYSGHTFTVTVFGLGLYELVRVLRPTRAWGRAAVLFKMGLLGVLAVVAVGEQVMEIYAVEKSRFHYTSDIVMALVVTFLMYTNGVVAIVSKKWCQLEPGSARDWAKTLLQLFSLRKALDALHGRPGAEADPWDSIEDQAEEGSTTYQALREEHQDKWKYLISGGDIFVPPCCIPCCCYAGRQHIYSDDHIKKILDNFVLVAEKHGEADDLRAPLQEYLQEHMKFSEGVSVHNLAVVLRRLREDKRDGDGYHPCPP